MTKYQIQYKLSKDGGKEETEKQKQNIQFDS